ncbi:MAG: hypothetical protein U5Q03_05695 [Bacteroidota bacterium]|nr:hypothetical protein [Bacteroidota bacterium]
MKTSISIIICFVALIFSSCNNNNSQTIENEEAASFAEEIAEIPQSSTQSKQLFGVESAYIKFLTQAAGQEMTREWRFDQYGKRQYEENYLIISGQKMGDKSVVIDGFQYSWGYDSNEGRKSKFRQTVTDYDKVSEKDIERYGIAKHGYEEVLGKKCLKVSIEKPAKSTIWVWEGIALKTEAVFSGNQVLMEAVEINLEAIDNAYFELPGDVSFPELN